MIGSLGVPEMLVLFVLALVIFGPRRLPELGRSLGKTMAAFRNASNEFRDTLEREVSQEERRGRETEPTAPAGAATPVASAAPFALPREPERPEDRPEPSE